MVPVCPMLPGVSMVIEDGISRETCGTNRALWCHCDVIRVSLWCNCGAIVVPVWCHGGDMVLLPAGEACSATGTAGSYSQGEQRRMHKTKFRILSQPQGTPLGAIRVDLGRACGSAYSWQGMLRCIALGNLSNRVWEGPSPTGTDCSASEGAEV